MNSIPFIFASGHRLSYWFISFSPDAFVFICRKLCQQNVARYLFFFCLLPLVFYVFFRFVLFFFLLLLFYSSSSLLYTCTHSPLLFYYQRFYFIAFPSCKKKTRNEIIINMYTHIYIKHCTRKSSFSAEKKRFTKKINK